MGIGFLDTIRPGCYFFPIAKMEEPCETPLFSHHEALGARMTVFGGWAMPLQYPDGIIKEHHHTRASASLFDTCHMGIIHVSGPPEVIKHLDYLLARPVLDQKPGTCRYTFLMSEGGGVRDDLIAYRMAEDSFMLVTNAGQRLSDLAFLKASLPPFAVVDDRSSAVGKLDLQGPRAADVLIELGMKPEDLPAYYHFHEVFFLGEKMLVSRTGYTGELGYEIYPPRAGIPELWERLLKNPAVLPAGLGARDTLRLEMGYPLYGHELDMDTTPIEAGFGGLIPQGRAFSGSEVVSRPTRKRLAGLLLADRRAARAGDAVQDETGSTIGRVTSGSFGPSIGRAVALAYLEGSKEIEKNRGVTIERGRERLQAEITSLPFWREGTARIKIS